MNSFLSKRFQEIHDRPYFYKGAIRPAGSDFIEIQWLNTPIGFEITDGPKGEVEILFYADLSVVSKVLLDSSLFLWKKSGHQNYPSFKELDHFLRDNPLKSVFEDDQFYLSILELLKELSIHITKRSSIPNIEGGYHQLSLKQRLTLLEKNLYEFAVSRNLSQQQFQLVGIDGDEVLIQIGQGSTENLLEILKTFLIESVDNYNIDIKYLI